LLSVLAALLEQVDLIAIPLALLAGIALLLGHQRFLCWQRVGKIQMAHKLGTLAIAAAAVVSGLMEAAVRLDTNSTGGTVGLDITMLGHHKTALLARMVLLAVEAAVVWTQTFFLDE